MISKVQWSLSRTDNPSVPLSPCSAYRGVLGITLSIPLYYSDPYKGSKVRTVRTLEQHSVFTRPTVQSICPGCYPTISINRTFIVRIPGEKSDMFTLTATLMLLDTE